uniref:Uncharacterized protein n=1 Tax=Helianthus annuus TaxID=4232 RepID=A0A251TBU3_HELAN
MIEYKSREKKLDSRMDLRRVLIEGSLYIGLRNQDWGDFLKIETFQILSDFPSSFWFDVPCYLYTRSEFTQITIPIANNTIESMSWERKL